MKTYDHVLLTTIAVIGLSCMMACGSKDPASSSFTVKGSSTVPGALTLHNLQSEKSVLSVDGGTPVAFQMNMYAVWVSQNEDCSSPVLVQDYGTATAFDLFTNPTLFSGAPADGTYKCIVVKLGNSMTFAPDATAQSTQGSACTVGSGYVFNIYHDDDLTNWKDVSGNALTPCATATDYVANSGVVYIFASTNPSAVTGGSLQASGNQVLTLSSALVVPGNVTLYMSFANRVTTNNSHCWLDSPAAFGFK